MFFRGRQPEGSVWRRFRAGTDGFSFIREEDYYAAHVTANAERVVDLFHSLTEHLPPAVDVRRRRVRRVHERGPADAEPASRALHLRPHGSVVLHSAGEGARGAAHGPDAQLASQAVGVRAGP